MARTLIPTNTIVRTGIAPALTAGDATDNMYFVNDGRTLLYVLNTGGASTLTFITPGTVDAQTIGDRDVAIGIDATEGMFIGPFPPSIYNQSDGTVNVDINDHTTLTLEAFRLPA